MTNDPSPAMAALGRLASEEVRTPRQAALNLWRRRFAESAGYVVKHERGRFYLYHGGRLTFPAIDGYPTERQAWGEAYLAALEQSDAPDRVIAGAVEDRLDGGEAELNALIQPDALPIDNG